MTTSFIAFEDASLTEEGKIIQKALNIAILNSIDNGEDISEDFMTIYGNYKTLIDESESLSNLYHTVRGINLNTRGEYTKSRPLLQKALVYYEAQDSYEGLFMLYKCLGHSYFEESTYALEFDYYYKVFRSTEDSEEIREISLDIAEVYYQLNLYEDTLLVLDIAKENFIKSGNGDYIA